MGKAIWKTNGAADKHLHTVARDGQISKGTKTADLREKWPKVYDKFTDAQLRMHLLKVKRAEGVFLGEKLKFLTKFN